jgi:hypothetical protein
VLTQSPAQLKGLQPVREMVRIASAIAAETFSPSIAVLALEDAGLLQKAPTERQQMQITDEDAVVLFNNALQACSQFRGATPLAFEIFDKMRQAEVRFFFSLSVPRLLIANAATD